MSQTLYLALPALHIVDYHAHAGAYIQGVPQPTTVVGLAHAIGLAMGRQRGIQLEQPAGVAYGVSDWHGVLGVSLGVNPNKAKATKAAPINDRALASVTVSMILELVLPDEAVLPELAWFTTQLERMRLQGGSLFNKAPAKVFTELTDAIRCMPANAFFLTEAASDMNAALLTADDTAEALLHFISRPSDGRYKPRWVPAQLGWRALTDVAPHPDCREEADAMVVAEPAIGLAQFRSKGSFRVWSLDPDAPVFWRHATEQCPSLHFVVKGFAPFMPLEFVF